jgi:hypothetical protein
LGISGLMKTRKFEIVLTKNKGKGARWILVALALLAVFVQDTFAQVGAPLWTNRFPHYFGARGRNAAVDHNGDVLVGGVMANGSYENFATLKYSSHGVPLWTNEYSGPAYGDHEAWAIATDSSNSAIITGSSFRGGNTYDIATLKYSSSGVQLWAARFNGPDSQGSGAYSIAVNRSDEVLVAGYVRGADGSSRFATIKYSPAGSPVWTNLYASPAGGDSGFALALDAADNVFVTGQSAGGIGTIAYSSDGTALWTNRYHGTTDGGWSSAISTDTAGNIFIAGSSPGANGGSDYATIKYSNAGLPLWTNRYHGTGDKDDYATGLKVDSEGNTIVTGYQVTSVGGKFHWATIKYSGNGAPLWTNIYGAGPGSDDYVPAIAVDRSGNVFVTGYSFAPFPASLVTLAYASTGSKLWTNVFDASLFSYGGAPDIVAAPSGALFVTGALWNGQNEECVTVKYSSSIPVRLFYQSVSGNLVLSWTDSDFKLQRASAINGPFTNVAGAVSLYTNAVAGAQSYFRLSAN